MRTLQQQWNDTLAMIDGVTEGFDLSGELEGVTSTRGYSVSEYAEDAVEVNAYFTSGEGLTDTTKLCLEDNRSRLDEERDTWESWVRRMWAVASRATGHEHYLYLWRRKQERQERFERLREWAKGKSRGQLEKMLAGVWDRYRSTVTRDTEYFVEVDGKKRRVIRKADNSGIYLTRAQIAELSKL